MDGNIFVFKKVLVALGGIQGALAALAASPAVSGSGANSVQRDANGEIRVGGVKIGPLGPDFFPGAMVTNFQ